MSEKYGYYRLRYKEVDGYWTTQRLNYGSYFHAVESLVAFKLHYSDRPVFVMLQEWVYVDLILFRIGFWKTLDI